MNYLVLVYIRKIFDDTFGNDIDNDDYIDKEDVFFAA